MEVVVLEIDTTETDAASDLSGDAHTHEEDKDGTNSSFVDQTADGDRGIGVPRRQWWQRLNRLRRNQKTLWFPRRMCMKKKDLRHQLQDVQSGLGSNLPGWPVVTT